MAYVCPHYSASLVVNALFAHSDSWLLRNVQTSPLSVNLIMPSLLHRFKKRIRLPLYYDSRSHVCGLGPEPPDKLKIPYRFMWYRSLDLFRYPKTRNSFRKVGYPYLFLAINSTVRTQQPVSFHCNLVAIKCDLASTT